MLTARWMTACRCGALGVVALLVAGCASAEYRFGETSYANREEVTSAVQEFVDSTLARIAPVQRPVGGQAVVILASKQRFRERGVARPERLLDEDKETAEFVAETLFMGHAMMGEAIRRAEVFDYVNIVSSDNPGMTAPISGGQFVVWYDLRDADNAQWFVRSRAGGLVRVVPVDTTEEIGAPRVQKWVQSVNDALIGVK